DAAGIAHSIPVYRFGPSVRCNWGQPRRRVGRPNGYRRYQRTHRTITSPGYWRPLNGLVGVIGMSLYGSRTASSAVRNGTVFPISLGQGLVDEDYRSRGPVVTLTDPPSPYPPHFSPLNEP